MTRSIDPKLGAAIVAAPFFWLLLVAIGMPRADPAWPLKRAETYLLLAFVYPILEEIVFRGGLQVWLLRYAWGARAFAGLSIANIVTSIVFAGLHVLVRPSAWAVAVAIPSLIFGYFRDRQRTLASPIGLHVFYNAGLLWMFGPP